ncbi:MAG: helix-turn-helix domain-containing protein [Gemmataceae bacterium]|nr:helix-turn-helix domain-containing protein [Gemmataceae bacterium]
MSVRTKRNAEKALPDSYFAMVKEFPLTSIRDDVHLSAAQKRIDELLKEDLDDGAETYLDALTDLVETYEDEHISFADASEAEVLRELMRSNGLTQLSLAKAVGISQSTISAVLNGGRTFTKQQVVALARFFKVSPAAFLPR